MKKMKRKKFLILFLVTSFLSPLWAKEEKVGFVVVSYIEGDMEVLLKGEKDWRKVKLNQKLSEGDRIRTKFASKGELKMSDGSTISISENSIFDIKKLFEKGLIRKSGFKLWIGNIKGRFKRLKTKDSYCEFYTPTAVMGLRGTEFFLSVDWDGRTKVGFKKGSGYVYTDKEGKKPISEKEEAEVSLEGDITIKKFEMIKVPRVIEKNIDDAKKILIDLGLKAGVIRAEESEKPKDIVISQYPSEGYEVLPNTEVNLIIAQEIPPIAVPDLIGKTKDQAELEITGLELVVGMVVEIESNYPKDMVIKQRPGPGTNVKKGSLVDIAISKGPKPKVTVPNLIRKTVEEAKMILEKIGLKLSGIILNKPTLDIEEGRIVDQRPSAGEEVDYGSYVQVWKAVAPPKEKPPIPKIHYRFSIPSPFINEICYLLIHITPADKKWAPLYLSIDGRLTKFDSPPYNINFRPPVMSMGINRFNVSAWFEGGEKAEEIIDSPYYDPIAPRIVNVKIIKEKIRVDIEDRESGINRVKIIGVPVSISEGAQEERGGRMVWTRGEYEKTFVISKDSPPDIKIVIEVEDNAGNKRTRTEIIPDVPPKEPSKK